MSQAHNEEEDTKRLLGLAVAGDPIALLDNINQPLGNGALDRALTGTAIRERWLGGNRIVTAPWNCLLVATGNNMQLVGDTTRRALPVRLESPEERPEERANFRQTDVRRWALEHRGWLLGAALSVLSAHLRGGDASAKPKPWGSFEGWSDTVRGAVIGCGLPDPCEGRAELVAVDSEAETARSLVEGVAALGATSEAYAKPVKELLAATQAIPLPPALDALRDALAQIGGDSREGQGDARAAQRVGNALRRYRGRVVAGRKLVSTNPSRSSHVARWFVVNA